MVEIKIKKLYEDAVVPTCGSALAAGHDLYARLGDEEETVILPHKTAMIGTGIAVAIPEGYWGGVFARSGLASKFGLRPANAVGVIDPDYRGEIIVALHNDTSIPQAVSNGDRIAQLLVCAHTCLLPPLKSTSWTRQSVETVDSVIPESKKIARAIKPGLQNFKGGTYARYSNNPRSSHESKR